MSTGKCNNFSIIKAHAIENRAQVLGIMWVSAQWTCLGVGEATVWCDR
jgi:hypothetical protein